MERKKPLRRRSGLAPGGPLRRSTPLASRTPLRRSGRLRRGSGAGLRSVSPARRKLLDDEYLPARDEYMAAHPWCEWPEGCGRPSQDPHHVEGRGVAPDRIADPENLMALCRFHHDLIPTLPRQEAEALGVLRRSGYERRLRGDTE